MNEETKEETNGGMKGGNAADLNGTSEDSDCSGDCSSLSMSSADHDHDTDTDTGTGTGTGTEDDDRDGGSDGGSGSGGDQLNKQNARVASVAVSVAGGRSTSTLVGDEEKAEGGGKVVPSSSSSICSTSVSSPGGGGDSRLDSTRLTGRAMASILWTQEEERLQRVEAMVMLKVEEDGTRIGTDRNS